MTISNITTHRRSLKKVVDDLKKFTADIEQQFVQVNSSIAVLSAIVRSRIG